MTLALPENMNECLLNENKEYTFSASETPDLTWEDILAFDDDQNLIIG